MVPLPLSFAVFGDQLQRTALAHCSVEEKDKKVKQLIRAVRARGVRLNGRWLILGLIAGLLIAALVSAIFPMLKVTATNTPSGTRAPVGPLIAYSMLNISRVC